MKKLIHQFCIMVGDTDQEYTHHLIKKELCLTKDACSQCWSCDALVHNTHPQLINIYPSKQYYCLEDLEIIWQSIRFARSINEPFFVIIHHMERFSLACSNSMLKIFEEPSVGYFFIGLTTSIHTILSTVQSRAHIIEVNQKKIISPPSWHLLFTEQLCSLRGLEVLESLDKANDLENIQHLDAITEYWVASKSAYAPSIIQVLLYAYDQGLSTGSGKIVWKNIFLHIASIKNQHST